jgi:DNA-binding GntR family transcriptional regulator
VPVPRSRPLDDDTTAPARRLLTDDVFDRLSDEIVRGFLAGGERIRDQDLAARLGLSRATVRTAILRLTDVGLVETVPNLYTRVTPIDVERYLQTQDTARALHIFAVRYGTPMLSAEQIDALRGWAAHLDGRDEVDREAIFNGSTVRNLMTVFQEAMRNRPLDRTMSRLQPHLQRVMGQYAHLMPVREVDAALRAVVDAAAASEADAAAEALTSLYDGPLAVFHARLVEQPEFVEG